MFEVIGMVTVGYLVLGVIVLTYLYVVDIVGMHKAVRELRLDQRWGELVFILIFSLWCWPLPLLDYIGER
jgi:hypothetical protein